MRRCIGDSRLLVLHPDGTFTPMSVDQKPNDPVEMARVQRAGGSVMRTAMGVWRIDGRLALSRSFGDFVRTIPLLPSRTLLLSLRLQVSGYPGVRLYAVLSPLFSLCLELACGGFSGAKRYPLPFLGAEGEGPRARYCRICRVWVCSCHQRMKGRADILPSQQKVVALPHARTIKVKAGDILVFACDGAEGLRGSGAGLGLADKGSGVVD